jgi:hypothetical protein
MGTSRAPHDPVGDTDVEVIDLGHITVTHQNGPDASEIIRYG